MFGPATWRLEKEKIVVELFVSVETPSPSSANVERYITDEN